jgi:hypothetical protein
MSEPIIVLWDRVAALEAENAELLSELQERCRRFTPAHEGGGWVSYDKWREIGHLLLIQTLLFASTSFFFELKYFGLFFLTLTLPIIWKLDRHKR